MDKNLENLNDEIKRIFGNNLENSTNKNLFTKKIIETTEIAKPQVIVIDDDVTEKSKLLDQGISIIQNDNDYFELQINNSQGAINLCKMLISIFGAKKMDFLLEKSENGNFNIKFSNSSNKQKVVSEGENSFKKFTIQMANVYNQNVDYGQSLKSLPILNYGFDIFSELLPFDGNIKVAYKYRNGTNQLAFSSNQPIIEVILNNSNVPVKQNNDYTNAVIGEGLTDEELKIILSKIYNNILEIKKLDPDNIYHLRKKQNNLGEAALTNSKLLIVITLAELFAIIVSTYFLLS